MNTKKRKRLFLEKYVLVEVLDYSDVVGVRGIVKALNKVRAGEYFFRTANRNCLENTQSTRRHTMINFCDIQYDKGDGRFFAVINSVGKQLTEQEILREIKKGIDELKIIF